MPLEDDYMKAQVDFMLALRTNLPGFAMTARLWDEIMSQPLKDFSGMLLNPFLEKFQEAIAPLMSAAQPLIQSLLNVVIAILKPIISILSDIVENAGPFFQAADRLLNVETVKWEDLPTWLTDAMGQAFDARIIIASVLENQLGGILG